MEKKVRQSPGKERRQSDRNRQHMVSLGIIYPTRELLDTGAVVKKDLQSTYVEIVERTDRGLCLKTRLDLSLETSFMLQVYSFKKGLWRTLRCMGKWKEAVPASPGVYLVGGESEVLGFNLISMGLSRSNKIPTPADFMTLKQIPFLKSVGWTGACPLLNSIEYVKVNAGDILMKQGEKGDSCFIVQEGTCIAWIKQKKERHQVGTIKAGGIVGEMALLTGEVRSATVEAKTDMVVWQITKTRFNEICRISPGVRNFLTEMITRRLSSRERTAKRKIGKYTITDIIGKGGYAIVYGGRHSTLSMPAAIKMMKHDMAMNDDFLERFRNEAQMIAQFNHRNIIKVYDIEEQFRTIFIIMEYLEGTPLEEMLEDVFKLDYEKTIDYLIQVCDGLKYAHERGIVHQDIKPANIFIKDNGRVKILDFGLACPMATTNEEFLGSPYYMSPEQIEMEAVDQRSDIYSLGIMAYEMVIGERPYPEDDLILLEDLHVEQDIPDPWLIDPEIPKDLRDFILKACKRDLGERFQDMREVLDQLQPLKEKYHLNQLKPSVDKIKMTTLHIFSSEENQKALNQLLEAFDAKASKAGFTCKIPGPVDIDPEMF